MTTPLKVPEQAELTSGLAHELIHDAAQRAAQRRQEFERARFLARRARFLARFHLLQLAHLDERIPPLHKKVYPPKDARMWGALLLIWGGICFAAKWLLS